MSKYRFCTSGYLSKILIRHFVTPIYLSILFKTRSQNSIPSRSYGLKCQYIMIKRTILNTPVYRINLILVSKVTQQLVWPDSENRISISFKVYFLGPKMSVRREKLYFFRVRDLKHNANCLKLKLNLKHNYLFYNVTKVK